MGLWQKLTNYLMPPEDGYENEFEDEAEDQEAIAIKRPQTMRKIAGGGSMPIFANPAPLPTMARRPELTVHTNPIAAMGELKVSVFTPIKFEDVAAIADSLKSNRAAVVNFERCDMKEQQRIFDFLNGACYVLEGDVSRISDMIAMYVPASVSVDDWRK